MTEEDEGDEAGIAAIAYEKDDWSCWFAEPWYGAADAYEYGDGVDHDDCIGENNGAGFVYAIGEVCCTCAEYAANA